MDEGGIRGSYSLYRDYIGYINTTSKYFGKATKAIKSHQRGRRKLCDLVCVNNCYWGFESFFCCNHPKRTTHNMYVATSSYNLTEIVLSPTRLRMVVSPIKISMTKELVIVHSLIHHLAFVPPIGHWIKYRRIDINHPHHCVRNGPLRELNTSRQRGDSISSLVCVHIVIQIRNNLGIN